MISLLTHTVAHSNRPSFRPKTNNQPLKKFLSLAISWVKVVKNCKILIYEAINSERRISHWMANPVLESFGESQKACVTNSSRPPEKLKGKENPDLPSVCSNYWPPNVALSLCFNHLVLSTFRQCRSAVPKRSAKPIARIHQTVEYPWRNPLV